MSQNKIISITTTILLMMNISGCNNKESEEVKALQKQVAKLEQQIKETEIEQKDESIKDNKEETNDNKYECEECNEYFTKEEINIINGYDDREHYACKKHYNLIMEKIDPKEKANEQCSLCDKLITPSEFYKYEEKCIDCYNKKDDIYCYCKLCNKPLTESQQKVLDSDNFCFDCYDKITTLDFKCLMCERAISEIEAEANGDVCHSCYDRLNRHYCNDCSKEIEYDPASGGLCDDCRSKYTYCPLCGGDSTKCGCETDV